LSNPKAFPCDELAIRSIPSSAAPVTRKSWILAATILGSALAFIDESVVNVALPRMESALQTTLLSMQWVINAYLLCMSALLLAGGAAGDQFGRRRVFIIGVTAFAVASLACGLAPNVSTLIAARAIQGIGAALLVPSSLALIGASFAEKERGAAIGVWSGATAIAAGTAPLLGGFFADHVSWRAIFLINPVLAIPTLWIALRHVPESRDPQAPPVIDWRGAVLAFAGLGCLVYGLISSSQLGWKDLTVIVAVAAGVALLIGFVLTERSSRWPMMPLGLFRSRTFSGVNLLTLLLYGALGGAFFFLPFLLIEGHGWSATAAGTAYIPFTLVVGISSRWSGELLDRFGARPPLIVGPTLAALGFLSLSGVGRSYWTTLLSMTLLGVGMAITVAPLTATVLNAVPSDRTGVASGINNAVASLGSLLAIALLGSVVLGAYNRALNERLQAAHPSLAVAHAVHNAEGAFVIPTLPASLSGQKRDLAHSIIVSALVAAVRIAMWSAALLALASALTAALTVEYRHPPMSHRLARQSG
jgi:EmrB/QacA subfamily drug resistance transporter